MSKWVTALKINGDFRGRVDGVYADHPGWTDRTRFRYRLRLAVVANLLSNFEVGVRLASGDIDNATGLSSGVDPISTNQSFQNNASKKGVFLDQAYARWSPLNGPEWFGSMTIGKMENPFKFSDMTFDHDYTPEGVAVQLGYQLNDRHALALNTGAFVLDEVNGSNNNPYYGGGQVRLESTWSARIASSIGVGILSLANPENLGNAAVPNIQTGNTRDAAGNLVHHYNPVVADATVTWTLESFPAYPTAFPIALRGDLMHNPAVSRDNTGYAVGVQFGKSGKKNTWDLNYTYKHLEADVWYEEHADSDFGAFYATALPGSGQGTGYRSGANIKGHIVRVAYSPYDFLTLSAKWFAAEVIEPATAGDESDMNRLLVDAQWKF
jgi:hypothetical protein